MASRLIAPQFLALYASAASVLAIRFRGRVGPSLRHEITHAAIFAAPYNALMYLFSAVPNKPFLPVSAVPELTRLNDNWEITRDQAPALFDEGRIRAGDRNTDVGCAQFVRTVVKRFCF